MSPAVVAGMRSSAMQGCLTALLATSRPWRQQFVRTMGFGSHCSDNNPDIIEVQTRKHLSGWNELLASDAEAVVKAERLVNDDGGSMDFAAMQAYTVQLIQQIHDGGAMEVQTTTVAAGRFTGKEADKGTPA